MSRLGRVTDTGVGRAPRARVRGWLRMLRADLWTLRPDPLPPSTWLRWLPHGLLCLTAFGVTLGAVAQLADNGGSGSHIAFPLGIAQGGAVVLALWRPVPAWWLSTAAMVAGAVEVRRHLLAGGAHDFTWPWTSAGIIGQMAVLLLLALRVPTRVSVEALALTGLLTYVIQGLWGAADYQSTGVLAVSLSTVVVIVGTALRGRREARAELVEQTTLTAEERTRRTLLEERSRIARELHDVVAHHMSVISIQAQVAPHLVENPPDELKENLAGIRQNALEALTELRRVLGVLRSEHPDAGESPAGPGGDTVPHAPQPDLDRLDALVENTRAAGREVITEINGERRPLPPGVELSAYRIVQEALSNVLRHAPGARATVRLTYLPDGLEVEVVNGRPTGPAPPSTGAGHGLLGMRERVAMLGGTMTAHPWHWDGFKVTAFLPDTPPADAPGTDHTTDLKGGTP
ncbi:sensor histidine kinase [Streptomyces lomondensis]|uniref:histidine kinase n=1 Tax=Streptomyces lomondensis TaxID=68229 RepID=A0ABQ2XES7_9ACTN|nr:sensor histidine kinase [Streptomyces lomondensis]MCF0077703.1 sensor histidine kinase [Streptomyces lomondensis]GGX13085.1 two-component sensor histidine kinase [Streptomyces lomondensis]